MCLSTFLVFHVSININILVHIILTLINLKTMPLDIAEEFHEKKLLELKTLHAVRTLMSLSQRLFPLAHS